MSPDDVEDFYAALREANPEPETELDFINPYTLLVAVVLSAQATDVSVNLATRPLFEIVRDPRAMLDLGEDALRGYIRTIGLYNAKAKNVIALSRALIENHGGEVPASRDALQKLAGVGAKTAAVVMNVAFGAETIAVDTHVFRVGNRTGLAPGPTPDAVEAKLDAVTPPAFRRGAHHWLILHGRHVCKARVPECWRCPVIRWCAYPDKRLEPPPPRRASARTQGGSAA